ncbi:MAG: ribonuclease Z [Nitrososphaerota archaeon]
MRIHFLGVSAAGPIADSHYTSLALQYKGEVLLFDCGEGTQRQLLKAGLGLLRAMRIFITHMHGDHVVGLLGILQSMSLLNRERPLYVYGPRGIRSFIETNSRLLKFSPTFPLYIQIVREGLVAEGQDYRVLAKRARHSIEAYSYLFEEKPRPGTFYPERAMQLGVPRGPLWKELQRGRDVVIQGRVIRATEVTGPPRRGRRVGYSGDTRPFPSLAKFFRDADLLAMEATYSSEHKDRAVANYHSTAEEAARLALRAGVKRLYLIHFSARYGDRAKLLDEARRIFPATHLATELATVELPP